MVLPILNPYVNQLSYNMNQLDDTMYSKSLLVGKEIINPEFYRLCFIIGWHGNLLCDNVSYHFNKKFQLRGTSKGRPKSNLYLSDYAQWDSNILYILLHWNLSCEATPFAPEKWPVKRGGLSSGVEINTFMFRFTLSSGLSRGGGISSGWPHKRVPLVL